MSTAFNVLVQRGDDAKCLTPSWLTDRHLTDFLLCTLQCNEDSVVLLSLSALGVEVGPQSEWEFATKDLSVAVGAHKNVIVLCVHAYVFFYSLCLYIALSFHSFCSDGRTGGPPAERVSLTLTLPSADLCENLLRRLENMHVQKRVAANQHQRFAWRYCTHGSTGPVYDALKLVVPRPSREFVGGGGYGQVYLGFAPDSCEKVNGHAATDIRLP